MSIDELHARLEKLGLICDDVPLDRLTSATVALACFPMYMVANVDAWTDDTQWQLPVAGGLPGSEALREAFEIGKQERGLEMTRAHGRVLGTLMTGMKPSDRVIYDYALETLRLFLTKADANVAKHVRDSVARSILAVARSSGEGFFGSGKKISAQEKACIDLISEELGLRESDLAAQILKELEQA